MVMVTGGNKIGVLGAHGLLGSAVCKQFGSGNVVVLDWRAFLGATDQSSVQILRDADVQLIVNCAAHTNVEAAEEHPDVDRISNVDLPGRLARACASLDLRLVHFSSTGCYGNWQAAPYVETDRCEPTTVHHRHKIEGEQAIQTVGCAHLILRTGWLFGSQNPGVPDFVAKRIIEARSTPQMKSDASQFGNPTYVLDVARGLDALLQARCDGIFNLVNAGSASRYEYVKEIVTQAGLGCDVVEGPAFPRKAKVSFNETALNARSERLGLITMRSWRDALSEMLSTVLSEEPR